MGLPLIVGDDERLSSVLTRLREYGWASIRLPKNKKRQTPRVVYKGSKGVLAAGSWAFWNWFRKERLIEVVPQQGGINDDTVDAAEMYDAEVAFRAWLSTSRAKELMKETNAEGATHV